MVKNDRTGTGTLSVFGRQLRHPMSQGFPLLTTKKMAWKTMVTELLWFLRGDTNIKYLLENNCHIWTGDAYKNYMHRLKKQYEGGGDYADVKQFKELILDKDDEEFSQDFGDMGPIYGPQWRDWNGYFVTRVKNERDTRGFLVYERQHHPGIDQVLNLVQELKTNPVDYLLILAPNFTKEIKKRLEGIYNGKYIIPVPNVVIE